MLSRLGAQNAEILDKIKMGERTHERAYGVVVVSPYRKNPWCSQGFSVTTNMTERLAVHQFALSSHRYFTPAPPYGHSNLDALSSGG